MAKLKELDIKPALTLASNPATKPLVLAGVKGSDDFPELLSEYKWTSAKPYDIALIIIAYYAYCIKSDEQLLKQFGKTAKQQSHNSFKLLNCLSNGNGTKIKVLMQSYFRSPMNQILETVTPNEHKRTEIIKHFVKQAGKITPRDFYGDKKDMLTYLIGIITDNKKEELKEELKQVKAHFTPEKKEAAKNAANIAPLKQQLENAIESNNSQIVQQVIESNPRFLNLPLPPTGQPPLHLAILHDSVEIVDLLLQQPEIDPNLQNNRGEVPLLFATLFEKTRIVSLLLQHPRINPNVQTAANNTPLHIAARINNRAIIDLLLEHGANPTILNDRGQTYLDLLPHQPRRIQVEDFPQNEFRNSFAENETRQCPICLEEYGANDLCCIFDCLHSEDYPFGHYLCNDCAQNELNTHHENSICPVCRARLKPHN